MFLLIVPCAPVALVWIHTQMISLDPHFLYEFIDMQQSEPNLPLLYEGLVNHLTGHHLHGFCSTSDAVFC